MEVPVVAGMGGVGTAVDGGDEETNAERTLDVLSEVAGP